MQVFSFNMLHQQNRWNLFWRYHTPCDWMTQIDKDPESQIFQTWSYLNVFLLHLYLIFHHVTSCHIPLDFIGRAAAAMGLSLSPHGTMALPLLITWMASCLWPWGEENPASIHWNLIMETYGLDPIQTLKKPHRSVKHPKEADDTSLSDEWRKTQTQTRTALKPQKGCSTIDTDSNIT